MCERDFNPITLTGDVLIRERYLWLQYFEHIEEMEWAIEVCKETGKATVATMCIGPEGDLHGVSAGDCAVRMAKAGEYPQPLTNEQSFC